MLDIYLTDRVTVRRAGALDAYNEPTASTDEANTPARFTAETKAVRDASGDEVVSSGNVLLKVSVTHADKIVYGGRTYAIAAIEELREFSVTLGYRVYLR